MCEGLYRLGVPAVALSPDGLMISTRTPALLSCEELQSPFTIYAASSSQTFFALS